MLTFWTLFLKPVIFKLVCQNHLQGLLKHKLLGPSPRVSDSVSLR